MIKKTVLAISLAISLVNSQSLLAADNGSVVNDRAIDLSSEQVDVNAQQQLSILLSKTQYFSADFSQRVLDLEGNEIQQGKGRLVVKKPNLVNWHITEPDESSIISDGKTLWLFDPFIEQATAFDLAKSITNTPILLLTNDDKNLWQNYQVTKVDTNTFVIEAHDINAQVKQLILTFEQEKLASFTIIDATGQQSETQLANFNNDIVPDNGLFHFTVPEGVLLDDQR